MNTNHHILLTALILQTPQLYADAIPENYLPVEQKVFITNAEQLVENDGYTLVACIENLNAPDYNACYQVKNDTPISKGYKFNPLRLIAVENEALSFLGGLAATSESEIDPEVQASKVLYDLSKQIEAPDMLSSGTVYVDPEKQMGTDSYYYEVSNIENNNVSVELKRRVITFVDGRDNAELEY